MRKILAPKRDVTTDYMPIHPDLRQAAKGLPRFTVNRRNLWLIRLLFSLQPKHKTPNDICIEQIYIPSQDPKHQVRLRVYKPKALIAPVPVLVWMHGGGLISGKPELNNAPLEQFAHELGMINISIDYRLAPEHPFPIPLDDCYTALKWVHSHAQTLGIDPQRIAIGGESAGGGLAACLVQLAQDRGEIRPIFQLLIYPMLDDRTALRPNLPNTELMTWTPSSNRFGWEAYLQHACGSDKVRPYSVAARREDLTGLPPAWVGVGTVDLFYEENATYAQKLNKCGVECELVIIPGAFHGFDLFGELPIVQAFRKSQVAALRKHLFPE